MLCVYLAKGIETINISHINIQNEFFMYIFIIHLVTIPKLKQEFRTSAMCPVRFSSISILF